MRNVLVEIQLQPLRVHQHHFHFVRTRLVQNRHHERVDENALAGARRPGNQQVRHGRKFRHADPSVQVPSHGQRQLARRIHELRRFDNFPQCNRLALVVRDFDANGRFAWDALDQNGFGLQREAQILRQPDNPAVLDARVRLEFECRDDWPGIDLRHAALDVKFQALCFNRACPLFQLFFIKFLAALAFAEQGRGRQLVIRIALRDFRLAFFGGRFLRVAIQHEDRRLAGRVLCLLLVLLLFAFVGQANCFGSLIQQLGLSDQLGRNGLPARKAGLLHAATHALLFALFAPRVPTRLRFLQNSQLLHSSDRTIRAACPCMRAGKRKPRGHKQRRHQQRVGHQIRAPQVEPGAQPAGNQLAQQPPWRHGATHIPDVP